MPALGFSLLALLIISLTTLLPPTEPTEAGGTIFTVTNADDPGNGFCDAQCTLREAIDEANGGQGNTIAFDLPGCPAVPANCVIQIGAALPALSQLATRIDGTTQPGYAGIPVVTIDGTGSAPGTPGLTLSSFFVDIKGLVIRDFPGAGIDASTFFLDGLQITDNRLTNNDGDGILLGPGFNGVDPLGHDILRNTIVGNGGTGVNNGTNCMQNALIASNTITGHTGVGKAGVELCGDGNQIHFNRMVDNSVGIRDWGFSSISDAQNNWWGCNEGPTNSDCDSSDESNGAADYDPWLVMSFNASPDSIQTGQTSTLATNMNVNSDGADTLALGFLPDGTEILFQTDLGTVGSSSVIVSMVSGLASATLTAGGAAGTAHVSAELDNETQNDEVTITEAPTPTPTPTPTDTPTPTPTPSPTPTPTEPPSQNRQGDINCDTNITSVDSLGILRFVAGLSPLIQQEPCPDIGTGDPGFFGDVDCKNLVTSVDALGVLRFVAGMSPLAQQEPCTDIGDTPATGT